jgi:enoyl-CoA hydratase/carnithine racemase
MLTEDLSVFFNEFAVAVSKGAVTGKGIIDTPTMVTGNGMVLSNDYVVTLQTAVFGVPVYGDALTVDGVAYIAREARLIDDGKLVEVLLAKV